MATSSAVEGALQRDPIDDDKNEIPIQGGVQALLISISNLYRTEEKEHGYSM